MKLRSYKTRLGVLAVTWVATAALVSTFYVAVLAPARAHCAQVGLALVEARRHLDWVTEATQPERITQIEEEATAQESRAGDFTYSPDGLAELALSVGRLATERRASNVSVQIRDVPSSKDKKRIVERRLEVGCNAGYHEFVGLLNAFERSRPVLLVDSLSLQKSGSASDKLNTNMTLTVLVDTQAQVQSPASR